MFFEHLLKIVRSVSSQDSAIFKKFKNGWILGKILWETLEEMKCWWDQMKDNTKMKPLRWRRVGHREGRGECRQTGGYDSQQAGITGEDNCGSQPGRLWPLSSHPMPLQPFWYTFASHLQKKPFSFCLAFVISQRKSPRDRSSTNPQCTF